MDNLRIFKKNSNNDNIGSVENRITGLKKFKKMLRGHLAGSMPLDLRVMSSSPTLGAEIT